MNRCSCGCAQENTHYDTYLLCNIFKDTNIDQRFTWFNTNTPSYCEYSGIAIESNYIECDAEGNIIKVKIDDFNVSGSIDISLGWPQKLQHLEIDGNDLEGEFLLRSFINCTDLISLDISDCNFYGELNESDWNAMVINNQDLDKIHLSNNDFHGVVTMSDGLYFPSTLRYFDIGYNEFDYIDWNVFNLNDVYRIIERYTLRLNLAQNPL